MNVNNDYAVFPITPIAIVKGAPNEHGSQRLQNYENRLSPQPYLCKPDIPLHFEKSMTLTLLIQGNHAPQCILEVRKGGCLLSATRIVEVVTSERLTPFF